jgi:hypothetical protein
VVGKETDDVHAKSWVMRGPHSVAHHGLFLTTTPSVIESPNVPPHAFRSPCSTPHGHSGCVSTGKEANVYHASSGAAGPGHDLAIKVYKTSILVFKDRDRRALAGWLAGWRMHPRLSDPLPP